MASYSEVFEKFEMWRTSKTPLKVTLLVEGKAPGVSMGRIARADSDASLVLVTNPLVMHALTGFQLKDCSFSLEASRLSVERNSGGWIVFEEVAELLPVWSGPRF